MESIEDLVKNIRMSGLIKVTETDELDRPIKGELKAKIDFDKGMLEI